MKLRIVHQNQENRDGCEEQVMKKEAMEMEQMEKEEEPLMGVLPEDDQFVKENYPPLDPPPAYDPMLVSVSSGIC